MKTLKSIYIGLGSNQGDRMEFLQKAIFEIDAEIGAVVRISAVYESPAFGFKGNFFLNACAAVKSSYTAEEILEKLLKIETALGRTRKTGKGYQNRTIDLDILLFEDNIITTAHLQVPHPEMEQRKFVLLPLSEIASEEKHPLKKTNIKALLMDTQDASKIHKISEKLKMPKKFTFPNYNYIAIEGNIGVGKTSFARMLSRDFSAKLILERFRDNPFLPKFYKEKAKYAFPLEMSFLEDRYQQLKEELAPQDLSRGMVISDYDIFKSLIFAKITLSEAEFGLYQKFFNHMCKELVKPDLCIYLHQRPERLLENIKTRGRHYEQGIKKEYLESIGESYLNFIKHQAHLHIKIVDISELDFVNERKDYLKILKEIKAT